MRSARRTRLTLEARREVLRQRLCKARTTMLLASPFYGVLATSLRIEIDADDAECTAWTDGQQMCFGLGYCEGVSDRHLTGLIAHEVLHVALRHPQRFLELRARDRDVRIQVEVVLVDGERGQLEGDLVDERRVHRLSGKASRAVRGAGGRVYAPR